MRRFSAFISILVLSAVLSSCSVGVSVMHSRSSEVPQAVEGADNVEDFSLNLGRRRSLSGTLVSKPVEGGFRAVGMSRFGMSLFDITVYRDSYEVNSCADFLKKRKLIESIASSLRKHLMDKYISSYSI